MWGSQYTNVSGTFSSPEEALREVLKLIEGKEFVSLHIERSLRNYVTMEQEYHLGVCYIEPVEG